MFERFHTRTIHITRLDKELLDDLPLEVSEAPHLKPRWEVDSLVFDLDIEMEEDFVIDAWIEWFLRELKCSFASPSNPSEKWPNLVTLFWYHG